MNRLGGKSNDRDGLEVITFVYKPEDMQLLFDNKARWIEAFSKESDTFDELQRDLAKMYARHILANSAPPALWGNNATEEDKDGIGLRLMEIYVSFHKKVGDKYCIPYTVDGIRKVCSDLVMHWINESMEKLRRTGLVNMSGFAESKEYHMTKEESENYQKKFDAGEII